MGILDDAIREHLELKRQHGAEEKEIRDLEADAFGPADRPDAVASDPVVADVDSDGLEEPGTEVLPEESGEAPSGSDGSPVAVDEPDPEETAEADDTADPEADGNDEPAVAEPAPAATEPDLDDGEGDASDLLDNERQRLASHPTEHYDVDAAIAEEDELDLLSESSLSDELDRALAGPVAEAAVESAPEPESDFEPITVDPPLEEAAADIEDAEAEVIMETPPGEEPDDVALEEQEEPEAEEEPEAGEEPEAEAEPSFFDQEDPLEGTPDFLEETPDHDRLWFEQKEPDDFDFGD